MPRESNHFLRPRLTWAQLQERMERQRSIREFDSFCVLQTLRVTQAVDEIARRIALGPELLADEKTDNSLGVEVRR